MPVPRQGHYVFTVFRLLTDFVCLYNYEFWLSLCKIVRSSVILLLPLLFAWFILCFFYVWFVMFLFAFCFVLLVWERAHPIHHLGTLRESTPYPPSGDIEREHTLSIIWGHWERAHPIHHLGILRESTPYPPSGDIEREHTLSTIWGHWERAHPIHFKMMKDLIKYNCLRVDIQLIVMCHFFILFYWTT